MNTVREFSSLRASVFSVLCAVFVSSCSVAARADRHESQVAGTKNENSTSITFYGRKDGMPDLRNTCTVNLSAWSRGYLKFEYYSEDLDPPEEYERSCKNDDYYYVKLAGLRSPLTIGFYNGRDGKSDTDDADPESGDPDKYKCVKKGNKESYVRIRVFADPVPVDQDPVRIDDLLDAGAGHVAGGVRVIKAHQESGGSGVGGKLSCLTFQNLNP